MGIRVLIPINALNRIFKKIKISFLITILN
jgi:hypothetical protein